jgi:glycosyltransferase involved in cell wall biosynthesis
LHNLSGNYFDLRYLPQLSHSLPTVITAHDTWLKAGHCTYSMDCELWEQGCPSCPHLKWPPAIVRDKAGANLALKRSIYAASHLHLAAPTRWVQQQMERSALAEGLLSSRVINYGIDLNIFRPRATAEARAQLGLEQDAHILLFAATSRSNYYKDFDTLETSIPLIAGLRTSDRPLLMLFLGGDVSQNLRTEHYEIRAVPFTTDLAEIASYYQASDLYLHAAGGEQFGIVTIEAQACGTPVVVTAVDGTPESLIDGETGLLVEKENPQAMAAAVSRLLAENDRRRAMAAAGISFVQKHFSLDLMVERYQALYQELAGTEPELA